MACLCCGAGSDVGSLCRTCAGDVPPCDGLIQDHLRSNVAAMDAEAWLVDGFGSAHALAEKSTIGRNHEDQIVVLAASVSREHAELKKTDAGWTIRDLGSRNGTFVDGVKCQGRATLPARAVIKVGDVAMWFLAEVADEPAAPPTMETAAAGGGVVRYGFGPPGGIELLLAGGSETTTGGALLARAPCTTAWKNHDLAPLEFQLLRSLCVRAHAEADSPATARGCVPTKQFVRDLPWQSKYANDENVRQVVRRLRAALTEAGADGILAVVPGRGYYLSCPVTISR
jgi:hypothetical protein